MEQGEGILT